MSIGPASSQMSSFLTVSTKRDALWNALQPGDPYDIRKSMIAKVPGDKKKFMGDYLQIVCLFQAAQIQRLCEFLDDFKLKYRQIQRRELDRHSYEIQIKQLNHKLAEEGGYKQENQKLKEFIKNFSSSRDQQEDSIKYRYQKLLLQYKSFEEQNQRLRKQKQQLIGQISSFDAKFQALRKSKQNEIDELSMKFSGQTNMSFQIEINSLRSQYESEIQRLDLENKRIKQLNDERSRQIESWHEKYRALEQQLIRSSTENDAIRYERQIAEFQDRILSFGQQIARLNLVVKEITNKFEISEQRNRELEGRLNSINREYNILQSQSSGSSHQLQELLTKISQIQTENMRLQQSGQYMQETESKLRFSNDQIARLTNQLRMEVQTSNRLKSDIQKYQYEGSRTNILQRELFEHQQTAAENNSLKERLAKAQNQTMILRQQIERLTQKLVREGSADTNYQNLLSEYQRLQKIAEDLERRNQSTVQQYESRFMQITSEYETRIESINRTKGTEFQSRATMLQSELQRLGDIVKRRNEEVQNYQKQIRDLQSTMSQSEFQVSRRVQNYESAVQQLRRQNQELVRRVRQLEPLQRRVNQHENKITVVSQQADRLNQQLRQKDSDIQNLRRQIREQEIAIVQKYQMDASRKIGNYEITLNNLTRENDDLKRRYAQMQNKAALLSQEIERLTPKMRQLVQKNTQAEQQIIRLQRLTKQTEVNITNKYEFQVNQKVANYETVLRNSQQQVQGLKRRISQLENANKRLVDYEKSLQQLSKELERLTNALKQKQEQCGQLDNRNRAIARDFQEVNRRYVQLQNTVKSKYEVQVTRTISTFQQNLSVLNKQNIQLKRYIEQCENRHKQSLVAIETLNLNFRNCTQQNQALKRQVRDIEAGYRQKLQVEVTEKYKSYQSNIVEMKRDLQNLLRQNNQLKRVLQVAEQNNVKLNQDNDELRRRFQQQSGDVGRKFTEYEAKMNQLQNQNELLKRRVTQLESAIRQYEADANKQISSLDQNLGNLSRQNEQIRRRLQQVSKEADDLRRVVQNMEREKEELARRLRQLGEVNRKVGEYEAAIAMLSQEHERTTNILKNRSDELLKAQHYIKELTQKLQSSQRNMTQSQSSIQQFEQQVKMRISQYEQNINVLNQEIGQLQKRLSVLPVMNNKIAEDENKIVIITQELERLNGNLRSQVDRNVQLENTLRAAGVQNDELKRRLTETQNTITQRYEVEMTRNIQSLEQTIKQSQNQNAQLKHHIGEYQQREVAFNNQIQRLTQAIRNLTEENNLVKNQVKQTEIQITRKFETEVNSKYSAYQRDISKVQRDNEELVRNLREYAERLVPEYENKIAILRQENERINNQLKQQSGQLGSNLKMLAQQNEELKRQIAQIQQIRQRYEAQTQQQFAGLQQNFAVLQKQNQDLKKYINQIGGHYEGLGQNITHLQKDNQELKRTLQQVHMKFESQANKSGSYGQQNAELKRRLTEMQHQIERLIKKLNELSQENETIRRQAKEGEMQIVQKFQSETTQQISVYRQQITQIEGQWKNCQREVQQLQRKLNDVGSDASRKITTYSTEIEKLNLTIREYDNKLRQLSAQNERIHRQMKEQQISLTQKWQTQYKNKINIYQQKILSINKTVQQRQKQLLDVNNRRIMQLQTKSSLLSQQLQRLNHLLRVKTQQAQKMRLQIQRLNNTLRLKLQEIKQFQIQHTKFRSVTQTEFTQLQESYGLIVRDNEGYKKNLFEYESRIKKVYGEFQRLQNIINEYKKERESLFQKNYGLDREIERLMNENKRLESDVEEVRLRLSDDVALQKRISEHMALMVILFAEIQSLRKRVKEKEREMEDVRRSSLAPFKLESRARGDSQ